VRLLSESIPKEFNVLKIGMCFEVQCHRVADFLENGRFYCGVEKEFVATLTLWQSITKPAPWKLLALSIYVQPASFDSMISLFACLPWLFC
jgi:hypothetical protein